MTHHLPAVREAARLGSEGKAALLGPVATGRKGAMLAAHTVCGGEPRYGLCQTNLIRTATGAGPRRLGRQLTPFGRGGRAVFLEDAAAIEVTVPIEMIVDRGVDGANFCRVFTSLNFAIAPSRRRNG